MSSLNALGPIRSNLAAVPDSLQPALQQEMVAAGEKKPGARAQDYPPAGGTAAVVSRAHGAAAQATTALLITPMAGAENCAAMLTRQLGLPVEVAHSRRSGLSSLRRQEYGIVIVDEPVVEADPQGADLLWQHAGLAVPVVINFAIAGSARVVREVKHAINRREREHALAKSAATLEMHSELKSTLTGLLLQSQLALSEPRIAPELEAKLRSVVALANDLRDRLRPTA